MSILNSLKKLLPYFGRRDIRDKLRLIASKIADHVLPSLLLVKEAYKESALKSAYGKAFVQAWQRFLPANLRTKPDQFVLMLERALINAKALTDLLDDYVGKQMGDQVHIEGITYQKGSVIRLIELLDFFVTYSSRQLAYLVASETNIDFGQGDGNPYSKAELAYLNGHQGAFFRAIELLHEQPKVTMATIERIPEVLIDDAAPNEVASLAGAAGDPLNLGIIPIFSGIFTFIGIRKVDYELDRFDQLQHEARTIAMRLEAKRSGNPDARQQKIIENYERELTLVRSKISAMEESFR